MDMKKELKKTGARDNDQQRIMRTRIRVKQWENVYVCVFLF